MSSVNKWPVVGHEWAVGLLEQAVNSGHVSHAYLLAGPAQVGKTTLARAFAQTLECTAPEGRPCGQCRACQRIEQDRFPDVQIVRAEKNTIQIEQVRALQADAALSPLEGRYRVFIVREIERATLPAANALLKTLEEPPSQVVLVLTCVRQDLVLPTIRSRCQMIGLRPLPEAQVAEALRSRWGVDEERAVLLARLSAGCLGWAVDAHRSPQLWETRAQRLAELAALAGQNDFERLAYSEELSKQPAGIEHALGLWATWWRDLMLVRQGLDTSVINLDRQAELQAQAGQYSLEQIERAADDVAQTLRRIRANVNARLALDVLLLRLPRTGI